MKVKVINTSVITNNDITEYKKRVSILKGNFFTGNDVGMDKRIITVRMEDLESELTLVNQKINILDYILGLLVGYGLIEISVIFHLILL